MNKTENRNIDAIRGEATHEIADRYESLPKIHGWVARNLDNTLLFHSEKPTYKAPSGCWVVRPCEALRNILWLNKNDFPEITSESEPVEVELLIRKV